MSKLKTVFVKNYRWVWWMMFSPILGLFLLMGLASIGAFGEMPDTRELEDPQRNLASIVYTSDSKILGKFYVENRVMIDYDSISPFMIDALVATEDERFYEHSGIDGWALFRAVGRLGRDGGGSTITQQLAKLLFHERPKSFFKRAIQKTKEWVLSLKLEKQYTKQEIIAMYLNQADFGRNVFGIESAAKIYFNTTPKNLTLEQAAMLVGMLKGPTQYNPVTNYKKGKLEVSKNRRTTVLQQMMKNNKLTKEEYQRVKDLPIIANFDDVNKRIMSNAYGHGESAPYFMEELKKDLQAWSLEHINPRTGKPYNIYKDGLRIYTTIDSRIQKYAEESVNQHMIKLQAKFFETKKGKKNAPFSSDLTQEEIDKIIMQGIKRSEAYDRLKNDSGWTEKQILAHFDVKKPMEIFAWNGTRDTVMSPRDSVIYHKFFLQNGVMAMDPHTGEIKAWVGGINFEYFKYDHVRAGKYNKEKKMVLPDGGRQVGSTFKPFVYSMAMIENRSPCEKVPNVRVCIDNWCPSNSGGGEGGMISFKEALANSVNYISALLIKQYGTQSVINLVRKMGVTSDIPNTPSICLGVADISVYEMVGAFSTFFNKGVYTKPIFMTRIEDKNGNILGEFTTETKEVMNEEAAYLMVELMKGVVLNGTSQRLRSTYKFKEPVAGKTGTTQNNSDGWFIGGTPDLVCGVWTGAEDRSVRFVSTGLGQGANMALPIFGLMMRKVYDDPTIKLNRGDFEKPAAPPNVETNCGEFNLDLLNENLINDHNFDDEL